MLTSYSKAMTKLEISIKEEQGKYKVTWWENTCDDDLPTYHDINVNYVHQLQHLLRTVGVDKEIEL